MQKIILALALLTLTSNLAYSEEAEAELVAAPTDYVMSLLNQCKVYATEEEVSKADMNKYLLVCINDDLADSYYKPIKVLPKED